MASGQMAAWASAGRRRARRNLFIDCLDTSTAGTALQLCGAANPGCSRLSSRHCRSEDPRTARKSRLKGGCGQDCPPHSCSGTVAFLILLAAAARAGVVAADFLAGHHLFGAGGTVTAHELQFRQLLFLVALDVAREVLH